MLNQIIKSSPRSPAHALTVYNGPGSDQWRDYTMEFDWYSHNDRQYPGPLIRVKSSSKPQFWWFEYYTGQSGSSMACMRAADGSWDGGWAHQPSRRFEVIRAQYNVSTYDEFEGRVASVETRGFWRDFAETDDGACNQGYHWNCNAASYYFIGTVAALEDLLPFLPLRLDQFRRKLHLLCAAHRRRGHTPFL